MLRIIFNIGLVSVLSFNLYAEVKPCSVFKPVLTDADSLTTAVASVKTDYASLVKIYNGCILVKSKAINEATEEIPKEAYEDAIKDALLLENSCASYNTLLNTIINRVTEKPETMASGDGVKVSALSQKIIDTTVIKNNSKSVASEIYALAVQKKIDIPVKDKIADWKKDEAGTGEIKLDNASQLYSLDKILTENKSNTDLASVSTKLDAALKGSFTTDTAITDFKTKLKDKKYDVASTDVTPSTGTLATDGGTAATTTTTTDTATTKDKLTDILLAQYLANLANSNNNSNTNNNNNSGVAAPVLTSKDKNSGGGSGSLAGANAGSRGNMDDDERKDMIARAKEREKAMMRMDMQRALYGNNPSGKALAKSPMAKDGSGSSLRDLLLKDLMMQIKHWRKKGASHLYLEELVTTKLSQVMRNIEATLRVVRHLLLCRQKMAH